MAIVLRADTGSALTHNQVDTNFTSFFYSASLGSGAITFFKTGSSALGIPVVSSSITLPGGTLWTASAADISRNSAVVITGSFRQGSAGLTATGENAHAQGTGTVASGWHSHAEGRQTQARGSGSHAEGYLTVATGSYSHAEGVASQAKGIYSHAEGNACIAEGTSAHAEGASTDARAEASHTEGVSTIVDTTGYGAHAEGFNTYASGLYSHAEGSGTQATGEGSHAEGASTISSGSYSHAEGGSTEAIGSYSHTEGFGTIALGDYQHVQGQYNLSSSAQSAFIIGNGTEVGSRRNLVFAAGTTFQVTGSLNVTGSFGLRNGAQGAGFILTSDANGAATWSPSFAIESIVTTTSITTETTGSGGLSQRGRCVIIDNGANNINLTVNGSTGFTATYIKHGSGSVSFVQGSGRTLIPVDGTLNLNGTSGSTATVISYSTSDYLRINNA
jgi:hypothetical protein